MVWSTFFAHLFQVGGSKHLPRWFVHFLYGNKTFQKGTSLKILTLVIISFIFPKTKCSKTCCLQVGENMRAQLVRDLHNYDPRVTNKSQIGIPKFHIRCPNISPFTYDLDTIRNSCNVFVSVLPLPLASLRLLFFDMPYHV